MQVKKQLLELDMEKWTGLKLGKEYIKAVCLSLYLFNFYAEYIIRNINILYIGNVSKIFLRKNIW